jgi:hypothetical protein
MNRVRPSPVTPNPQTRTQTNGVAAMERSAVLVAGLGFLGRAVLLLRFFGCKE